jgi:hypothetical protein
MPRETIDEAAIDAAEDKNARRVTGFLDFLFISNASNKLLKVTVRKTATNTASNSSASKSYAYAPQNSEFEKIDVGN